MAFPSVLISWIDGLHQNGQTSFALPEALAATGLSRGAFLDAAERLQRKERLHRVRNGFYVPIRESRRNVGAPCSEQFLGELMAFEGCEYYVAFLMAAHFHAAGHHAVGSFQVVSNKRLPPVLRVGPRGFRFCYRRDFGPIRPFLQDVEGYRSERTEDRRMLKVSTPELTLFDLVARPGFAGGYDNIANVAIEIGSHLAPDALAACSELFPRAVVQRAGFFIEQAEHRNCATALEQSLVNRRPQWVEFHPRLTAAAADTLQLSSLPAPLRSRRWRVIVRQPLEPDVNPGLYGLN